MYNSENNHDDLTNNTVHIQYNLYVQVKLNSYEPRIYYSIPVKLEDFFIIYPCPISVLLIIIIIII